MSAHERPGAFEDTCSFHLALLRSREGSFFFFGGSMSLSLAEFLRLLHTERRTYKEIREGDLWVREGEVIHIAHRSAHRGTWKLLDTNRKEYTGRIRDRKGYAWFDIIPEESMIEHFQPPFRQPPPEEKAAPAAESLSDDIPDEFFDFASKL